MSAPEPRADGLCQLERVTLDLFKEVAWMELTPRAFGAALDGSKLLETEWGVIPTIGIWDLVELKKTQRIEDYPIIPSGWCGRLWSSAARSVTGVRVDTIASCLLLADRVQELINIAAVLLVG
jgi:hypothetical protein